MRIILSRKSMDAQCGGLPSPVLCMPDGTQQFFPLPIPYVHSDVHYSSIHLFDQFTAWDFIKDVAPHYKQQQTCHLDPDLRGNYLPHRAAGWRPAFGQVMQAQTHLQNNGVGCGDLFLFFGWFQFAELRNGTFYYAKTPDYPAGFHAIYGYLQVGEIFKPNVEEVPAWLQAHPHVQQRQQGVFKNSSNTLYVAAEFFQHEKWFPKPGGGPLPFSNALILTKRGQPNRTLWQLPGPLHPDNGVLLSYHTSKSWARDGEKTRLRSASQGQEFIFTNDATGAAQTWAASLIQATATMDT